MALTTLSDLSPPSRRSGYPRLDYRRFIELREKRHRGPKLMWPLARWLTNATRHLPHWARPVHKAIDRAAFETTIVPLSRRGSGRPDES